MKTTGVIRKALVVLSSIGFCVLGGFFLLNYAVDHYHKGRVEEHKPILEELKRNTPSQEQIQNVLGEPIQLLSSAEALELSRGYSAPDEVAAKCIKYSKIMFYNRGDIVYFIYLNGDQPPKMVDFSIIRN